MNGLLKPTPSDYCQVWKPKMSSAQAMRRQGEREQEQDQNTHNTQGNLGVGDGTLGAYTYLEQLTEALRKVLLASQSTK